MVYVFIPLAILVLAIIGLILYIPGPSVKQTEKTAWLKSTPVAHRGLHTDNAEVPENSMAAFQRAIDKGYAIEFDVVVSADGRAIVFHDYDYKRMAGVDKRVIDIPWEETREFRLLGTDQGIHTFREVLEFVDGRVPLLIEVKNEGSVGVLEQAIIKDLENYNGEFAIQAFNPFVLKYFKEHAPQIPRGQLSGSYEGVDLSSWKKFVLRYLLLNGISEPQFVAYQTGTIPKWLPGRLKQKGLYLLTWTVKTEEDYESHKDIVDNVIFEIIDL